MPLLPSTPPSRALVGNDVVFLDDPHNLHPPRNSRWLARVLDSSEQRRVEQAGHPHTLAWVLFAAKEAAFKVVSKLVDGVAFAHRRFVVSDDARSVTYQGQTFPLRVEMGNGWVHAIVTTTRGGLVSRVARPDGSFCPSTAVRELACGAFARTTGVSLRELAIRRDLSAGRWDGRGPPYFVRGSTMLPVDLSLSHDGPFVAFAATLLDQEALQ